MPSSALCICRYFLCTICSLHDNPKAFFVFIGSVATNAYLQGLATPNEIGPGTYIGNDAKQAPHAYAPFLSTTKREIGQISATKKPSNPGPGTFVALSLSQDSSTMVHRKLHQRCYAVSAASELQCIRLKGQSFHWHAVTRHAWTRHLPIRRKNYYCNVTSSTILLVWLCPFISSNVIYGNNKRSFVVYLLIFRSSVR